MQNKFLSPFQSLTGSIHTVKVENQKMEFMVSFNPSQVQFTQFLIDEIKFNEVYVSIPHRFNSHGEYLKGKINKDERFQSLTGSIHTTKAKISAVLSARFNPSQVQFTPYCGRSQK